MKFRQYIILQISNILPKYKFTEDQIFSLLRIIQNFENRRKIFSDKKNFDQHVIERQSPQKVTLSSLQAKNDEDIKFNDIFKSLSLQLSEAFAKKSIEIS